MKQEMFQTHSRAGRASLPILMSMCLIMLTGGCMVEGYGVHPASRSGDVRGHEPWVFRTVLDDRPRMLVLAFRPDFWVAYSVSDAALYRVWADGVDFDGPVYTATHGPQPRSLGAAYLGQVRDPWSILEHGELTRPEVEYRGHRLVNDEPTLLYDLKRTDGTTIQVEERPEFVASPDGTPGLRRTFLTRGVPNGVEVVLEVALPSPADDRSNSTDGGRLEAMPDALGQMYARLYLAPNGTTRFSAYFADEPAPDRVESMRAETRDPVVRLVEQSGCASCHHPEETTIGPSYRAISGRYAESEDGVAILVDRIISGSAGNWADVVGGAVMPPHPNLSEGEAQQLATYILSIGDHTRSSERPSTERRTALDIETRHVALLPSHDSLAEGTGLVVNIFRFAEELVGMPSVSPEERPVHSGIVPTLHAPNRGDFGEISTNFLVHVRGYLTVEEPSQHELRLVSRGGARLRVAGHEVIDDIGGQGLVVGDATVALEPGRHRIEVDYVHGERPVYALSLQWRLAGEEAFTAIPTHLLSHDRSDIRATAPFVASAATLEGTPGDGQRLAGVHPSFTVENVRPSSFQPRVGGLDVLPDGRLVVSTWDPTGSVYMLSNLGQDPEDIEVQRIASGLLEPLGIKAVDGKIYVIQKHEITQLIDNDGDGFTDEYRTLTDAFGAGSNFHEFAFGLEHRDGYLYGTLGTAVDPGGVTSAIQHPDRGTAFRVSIEDGTLEIVASGLRTPNGIGFGVNADLFISDNQGDWLPASKIVALREGAWYGWRPQGDSARRVETPPVVWLPQDEIGNSPSQPALLNVGPYQNQMVHGEVTHGGLKRVFVEEIEGQYQGVVFRFSQGLDGGTNRVVVGPDGHLYVGGVGSPGNWGHRGNIWYGLQRLRYNRGTTFEMLAVRARSDGLEIEFSEALEERADRDEGAFQVHQWWYEPSPSYGGPKMDEEAVQVRSLSISPDRRNMFLETDQLKPGNVVYLRLPLELTSESGQLLWSTEAWYTLNRIPTGRLGPSFR